jgi:hypothetical protein
MEGMQEGATEQTAEHFHGQKEVRAARHPRRAIVREASSRHEAMDMWMML